MSASSRGGDAGYTHEGCGPHAGIRGDARTFDLYARGVGVRRFVFVGLVALGSGCSLLLGGDLDGASSGGLAPDGSGEDGKTGSAESGNSNGDGGVEGSIFAAEDAGLSTGDLRIYYAKSTGELFTRTWTHVDAKWQSPALVKKVGADRVPWVVPTISHFGSELVATLVPGTTGASLDVFSGAGLPLSFEKTPTVPNGRVSRRGVDVAHGSATGAGLVVYADDSALPKFRHQTTTGWTEEAAVMPTAAGTSDVDWIRLVAHPTTDEITLLFTDTSRHLYSATWNGSAWSSPAVLDTSGVDIDGWLGFAGAYEATTGNFLVVWTHPSSCNGPADLMYFATKPSGQSVFSAVASPNTGDAGLVAGFGPALAASEPGTNRIAISAMEYADCCKTSLCNDWQSLLWDGTWKSNAISDLDRDPKSSYPTRAGSIPVEVGWLGTTGRAVTIYAHQSKKLAWATWTADLGWIRQDQISFTPPLDDAVSYAMGSLPSVGALAKPALVLLIEDVTGRLWAKIYDGSSWTDMNDGQPVADGVPSSEGRSFGVIVR